jgi:hypothetical protein
MKKIGVLAVLLFAFVVAFAQQPPSPSPPSQPGQTAGTAGCGMMGPTSGGPMSMAAMGARHQQMVELMDKLMQSMSAIEAEKDPAALKSDLAAHRVLLEQMHSHMMQRGAMMQQRGAMPDMPRMGGSVNQAPPSK